MKENGKVVHKALAETSIALSQDNHHNQRNELAHSIHMY